MQRSDGIIWWYCRHLYNHSYAPNDSTRTDRAHHVKSAIVTPHSDATAGAWADGTESLFSTHLQ